MRWNCKKPERRSKCTTEKRRSLVDSKAWVRQIRIELHVLSYVYVSPSSSLVVYLWVGVGLGQAVLRGVLKKGYKVPTPIQRKVRSSHSGTVVLPLSQCVLAPDEYE